MKKKTSSIHENWIDICLSTRKVIILIYKTLNALLLYLH